MINASNYYSLVNKETNIIVTKGSKRNLLKILKANRGCFYLALTSRQIGECFK